MNSNVSVILITGSSGLVGSEAVEYFADKFDVVVGIDNNLRSYFFGRQGDTEPTRSRLRNQYSNFVDHSIDIRDQNALSALFLQYGSQIKLVIHAAAQPSHDWAAREPMTDFGVNATGTLNLLELTRLHCPEAVFIYTSTNKVYGDTPNKLPLVELDTRWEVATDHPYAQRGIDEHMTIDQSMHSLFGASKLAADILVQEYGRYFGMKTGVFRCGCLTGPNHAGAQLHGFLSYLMKCTVEGIPYSIFGYKGKQVRDNLHSFDLVTMFNHFYLSPRSGEVYNVGGGRFSHCSVLEAIELCEHIAYKKLNYTYVDEHRTGDHIWYVSDVSKFQQHYPAWSPLYDLESILRQIFASKTSG